MASVISGLTMASSGILKECLSNNLPEHLVGSLPSLSGAEILIENNTAEIEWTHDKAVGPEQVSKCDVP